MRILDVIRCDRNEGEEKRVQNTLFISAVTGEKKLRPDVIAIVQNEITVVDEHIPAPGEIQSDETIVLPEIVSMTEYIRRHCENEIVDACINQIDMLRLCVVYEGKLFHDVPGLGPVDYGEEELVLTDGPTPSEWGEPCAHSYDPNVYVADVRPVDGSITWMSFRRIADGCIEADLTIEMEINFRYGSYGRFKRITQKYYTTAWFDFNDDEDSLHVEYGEFTIRRQPRNKSGTQLDEYLVPVFKWEDIEEESETIIFNTVREGLTNPQWLQPGLFAERMGLKIVSLPLYKRPETSSILFFSPGEVLTAADPEEELEPVPVRVDEHTIVLNSSKPEQERDAIFHECFHYAEHRLFFQLQQLHNTDIRNLARWKPVELKKDERSPIEWIEWQAHVGSQCLQMPKSLLRKRISEELTSMQTVGQHMGFKLQAVGRKLAKEFGVYNYRLRNRMIQVGFPAARGALNFVEDDYITPFAFSLSECRGGQTFVISPKEMLDEYVRNEAFRERIDTGHYIYADGHICLNEPQYVVHQGDKLCLTQWANAHVDQCCLRFVRNYIRDKHTHYVFGQLNSDEEYNGRSLALSIQNGVGDVLKQAREMSEVLLNLPGSFSGTLVAHMKRIGITRDRLAEEAMMSETMIKRMRTSERDLTLDQVIAVCVGLHIQPEYSFDLIEKAGFRLRNTPEHLIYKSILQTMYMEKLMTIQKLLVKCGCDELRLKDKGE